MSLISIFFFAQSADRALIKGYELPGKEIPKANIYGGYRKGHYQRALEEAVQTHTSQWPRAWEGKNPLHGGRTFATMNPEERVG